MLMPSHRQADLFMTVVCMQTLNIVTSVLPPAIMKRGSVVKENQLQTSQFASIM